jgi:hypothetical protein
VLDRTQRRINPSTRSIPMWFLYPNAGIACSNAASGIGPTAPGAVEVPRGSGPGADRWLRAAPARPGRPEPDPTKRSPGRFSACPYGENNHEV